MKKESSAKPASDGPASNDASAPRRAHALNTITLELNAATALRSFEGGKWASVFAIHNRYCGKEKPSKAVPISVKFSGNTVAYAVAAIQQGTHFTVTGTLDFDAGEKGKDFYRINADQLRVHSHKDAATADDAA